MTMAGIFLVVVGYGMYQPAAYAGVRKFTNPKTAGMGYAMLYALMNLGGWLPTLLQRSSAMPSGSPAPSGSTPSSPWSPADPTWFILTPKVERDAIARAEKRTRS